MSDTEQSALREPELTDRQRRELEYHREHAKQHSALLSNKFSYEVLENPGRRWWNAYWRMYQYLIACRPNGKRVLVVGCGFGGDALRLAKLGAKVTAFDLSPESLSIARALAVREQLDIRFDESPAERLPYSDESFDLILAIDILHHVNVPVVMREISRVAKPGAILVLNEIYSHSVTETVRRSWLVEKFLYPKMQQIIYGHRKPYITEDERKLTELDIKEIRSHLGPHSTVYFNFLVTRLIPDRWDALAKIDRFLLALLKPISPILAGRLLFTAPILKRPEELDFVVEARVGHASQPHSPLSPAHELRP